MSTKSRKLLISFAILFLFFISGCKKITCLNSTALTDRQHIVNLNLLKNVPEFLDTLKKYPQLQAYELIDNEYAYTLHCYIFVNDLKLFYRSYSLTKGKLYGNKSIYVNNQALGDQISISTKPQITWREAVKIAKDRLDFSKTCIFYRLGYYDLNAGNSTTNNSKNYTLAWKINGNDENPPVVIVDANTGLVISAFDGIWQ